MRKMMALRCVSFIIRRVSQADQSHTLERLGRVFGGRGEAVCACIWGCASKEERDYKGKDCGKGGAEGGKGKRR